MRRSIAFRITAVTTLLTLVAVVTLAVVTLTTVRRATTAMLAAAVATDTTGLVDIYASGGRDELVRRIGDRVAWSGPGGQFTQYALLDQSRRIAGDLGQPVPLDATRSQRGFVTIGGRERYAQAVLLAPGLTLQVARAFPEERALLATLERLFAIVGSVVVATSGLLALVASRLLAGRVSRINRVYAQDDPAAVADLERDRTRDEIGELARNSGKALARVAALADAQRHVSDQIAHEVRTPLAHLDRRVAAMGRNPECAAEAARARAQIVSLTGLLDSLLDIAASEARRGDRRGFVPVDLSALLHELDELYRPSLEEAGLRFTVAIRPATVVLGNAMDLQRMISNLLDNAIRHVASGHSVTLELTEGPVITVRDDGPGIPPTLRDRLFERFTRSDGGGHGLGLALVRAIAERHGLTVALLSGPGTAIVIAPEAP